MRICVEMLGFLLRLTRNEREKTPERERFEEKVFDLVLEDLHNRNQVLLKPVLVINLEVKDNHEEAAIGGRLALILCQELDATENWEDTIDDIINNFEKQHRRKLLYSISFY